MKEASGFAGRLFLRAVEAVQRFQNGHGLLPFDPVKDRLPRAATIDQPRFFQLFELLRHGGLRQPAGLRQIPNRTLSAQQSAQDLQPRL